MLWLLIWFWKFWRLCSLTFVFGCDHWACLVSILLNPLWYKTITVDILRLFKLGFGSSEIVALLVLCLVVVKWFGKKKIKKKMFQKMGLRQIRTRDLTVPPNRQHKTFTHLCYLVFLLKLSLASYLMYLVCLCLLTSHLFICLFWLILNCVPPFLYFS